MSRHSIRRRLMSIESRCYRPPITAQELAQLIVGASAEVLEELFTHPLLQSATASEAGSELRRCSRCGRPGPFSEAKPFNAAPKLTAWDLESEPVTVRQLRDGFDRATLATLEDAICFVSSASDPGVELMMIECLVCGHAKPQFAVQPGSASPQEPI
jgi:hypothetical protein